MRKKNRVYEPPKEEIIRAAVRAGKWEQISMLIAKTTHYADRQKLILVAISAAYYDGHEKGEIERRYTPN